MKELSVEETTSLVNAYVKTFGYREGAKKLTERGYKSREGKEIRHAHLSRILSGSPTQFLASEPELKPESPAKPLETKNPALGLTPRPKAPVEAPLPSSLVVKKEPLAEPFSDEELASEERYRSVHAENRKVLREELQEEIEVAKVKEANLAALVPGPSGRGEHPHVQQMAKVTGIFTRRGPAPELEEEKTYYGIPAMQRKSSVTTTRPHEVTHFGSNVISTKDLSVKRKKMA